MKKIGLGFLWLVISSLGFAQVSVQTVTGRAQNQVGNTPTPADMYCSGFISEKKIPETHYIVGGRNSPDQSHFAGASDWIYIYGTGIKEGDKYLIVRRVVDPDKYEGMPGQNAAIKSLGEPYFERGFVRVVSVQKNVGIAVQELKCSDVVTGDIAIPFVERETPVFRDVKLDRFAPPNGKPRGRIVLANEFDTVSMGSRSKVYLSIGGNKGIKVGDYLRATRTYDYSFHDPVEGMSFNAYSMEDTQKDPPILSPKNLSVLPRRTVADMIVVHVHPTSATAMVLTALEDVHVGDGVELMDVSDAPFIPAFVATPPIPGDVTPPAAPPPAPAPRADANPPTIRCNASPANVRVGQSTTISCETASPDSRPVKVRFKANGGKLTTDNNQATLDTGEANAGPISVDAIATDDRDISSSASVTVNVEAAPSAAPTVQKVNELQFKPNSAYVDNRSKAALDDVALKLQQDPASTLVLSGDAEGGESPKLANQRAQNAMNYLTQSKGIDNKRIQLKTGTQLTRTVDVWSVPPGASLP